MLTSDIRLDISGGNSSSKSCLSAHLYQVPDLTALFIKETKNKTRNKRRSQPLRSNHSSLFTHRSTFRNQSVSGPRWSQIMWLVQTQTMACSSLCVCFCFCFPVTAVPVTASTFVLKPHEFKIITITVIINEPGFYLLSTNNLDATFLNVLDVCFDGVWSVYLNKPFT